MFSAFCLFKVKLYNIFLYLSFFSLLIINCIFKKKTKLPLLGFGDVRPKVVPASLLVQGGLITVELAVSER